MNKSEMTLINKDIREVTSSKQVLLPMIIVPFVLAIVLPSILVITSMKMGNSLDKLKDMGPLLKLLPIAYKSYTPAQLLLYASINYIFPAFFLLIPIMASSILGASSFVGEKEHKTMETLLYTPISMEQLLKAKILGVFVPAYIITLLSFIGFGVVINIGGYMHFGQMIFPNIKWLIVILWLIPALTMFALTFTVLISAKSETFQGAQQFSALLILPVIFLIIGQTTGLFLLNDYIILAIGAVLFVLDYVLIKRIAKKFTAESLV